MDASAEPIRRIDNPGIKAEGGLLHELRREVAGLLSRSQLGFPGAQPVSFARRHLQDLMSQEYVGEVSGWLDVERERPPRARESPANRAPRAAVTTSARRPTAYGTSST